MRRVAEAFTKKQPFIAYLTAGDGGLDFSLKCFLALIQGGVDILEIGVPFSDPVADGPVIQKAMQRALRAGITLSDVLELVKRIRKESEIPIVLFSYYNPLLQAGRSCLQKIKEAGADGLLVVDLPLEESLQIRQECKELGLDLIQLIAPSTSPDRIRRIAEDASGFLYCVLRKGTTGIRNHLAADTHTRLQEIKKNAQLPVACGFGISSAKMAGEILQSAEGFVIGSLFVQAIEKGGRPEELTSLAQSLDPRRMV